MGEIITGLLRSVFLTIDKVVAAVINWAYSLIMQIADVNVFNDSIIGVFGRRIYALIGIFMLFKMSFTLINYLINPDDFSSKDKGFGKIVMNAMISIVLMVFVPIVFKYAFVLQGELLNNHVLERVILGVEVDEDTRKEEGNYVAFAIYSAFYIPNRDIPAIGNTCDTVYNTGVGSNEIGSTNTACGDAIKTAVGDSSEALVITNTFSEALRKNSISLLYSPTLAEAKVSGEYLFDYSLVIATAFGVITALLFINFCFDVSIRAVKLGFLQLMSPIAIISYIDPKSGKDGIFKKWQKETVSTFLDLFIRLAAIFFAIFIISLITQNSLTSSSTGEAITNPLITVFITIGALMFAKQMPKLISDITGIKLDGGFTLNPMKKLGAAPFVTAAAGGIIGSGATAIAKFNANKNEGAGIAKSLLSGGTGLFTGGFRGAKAGYGAAGKDVLGAAMGVAAKPAHKISKYAGTNVFDRSMARLQAAAKIPTTADKKEAQMKTLESYINHAKTIDDRAASEIAKKANSVAGKAYDFYNHETGEIDHGTANDNVELEKSKIEQLKATGASAEQIAAQTAKYNALLKAAKESYIDNALAADDGDAVIKGVINEMNDIYNKNKSDFSSGTTNITSSTTLSANKGSATADKSKIGFSSEYKESVKVRDAVKK